MELGRLERSQTNTSQGSVVRFASCQKGSRSLGELRLESKSAII